MEKRKKDKDSKYTYEKNNRRGIGYKDFAKEVKKKLWSWICAWR